MDINYSKDKAGRLDYSESLMTHAMVLTGVDLDENSKSTKWKVENSWGDKVGRWLLCCLRNADGHEYTPNRCIRKKADTARTSCLNERTNCVRTMGSNGRDG